MSEWAARDPAYFLFPITPWSRNSPLQHCFAPEPAEADNDIFPSSLLGHAIECPYAGEATPCPQSSLLSPVEISRGFAPRNDKEEAWNGRNAGAAREAAPRASFVRGDLGECRPRAAKCKACYALSHMIAWPQVTPSNKSRSRRPGTGAGTARM